MRKKFLSCFTAAVMASAGLGVASALPASAAPGPNVSAVVSPGSWQTNNTVWAIAPVNGDMYVGGRFTSVRPPGDPAGTGEVASTYLAEFDASTGALVTSFTPTLDGQVTALAVSPDGSTLYVGGSFTHVNGSFRNHLAAFSTSTGALSTTWVPKRGQVLLHRGVPRRIGRLHRRDLRQARRRRAHLRRRGDQRDRRPAALGPQRQRHRDLRRGRAG